MTEDIFFKLTIAGNFFQIKSCFLRVRSKSLLKTLDRGEITAIFIKFEIVVCKLFEFGRVYILLFWKWLTLYNTILTFNSLPKEKILHQSKFKAFADYKINVTKKLKFVLERIENIVGKGETVGYQYFLLFP